MGSAVRSCTGGSGTTRRRTSRRRGSATSGVLALAAWVTGIAAVLLLPKNNCGAFVPVAVSGSNKDPPPPSVPTQQQQQWQRTNRHGRGSSLPPMDGVRGRAAAAAASSVRSSSGSGGVSETPASISSTATLPTSAGSTARLSTKSATHSLRLPSRSAHPRRERIQNLRRSLAQKLFFRRKPGHESGSSKETSVTTRTLDFAYDYDVIELLPAGTTDGIRSSAATATEPTKTTGILLIHPIGVGIARWYYQRLVSSLVAKHASWVRGAAGAQLPPQKLVLVVPDLLGSGSACNATVSSSTTTTATPEAEQQQQQHAGGEPTQQHTAAAETTTQHEEAKTFPLFNISDWTDQLEALIENESIVVNDDASNSSSNSGKASIDRWCVVANGGGSPIALQLAERGTKKNKNNKGDENAGALSSFVVSNVVLSSLPRLPFFLKNETTAPGGNDPSGVAGSYETLSGIPGRLFWWYSCRREGAFIQAFSEKNLIADPANLGPDWRRNCYRTAVSHGGRGRFATFSFLAGTLRDGCARSLEAVRDTPLRIDVVRGADARRNRAKSWFWQNQPPTKKPSAGGGGGGETSDTTETEAPAAEAAPPPPGSGGFRDEPPHETFRDYAERNGNGGGEILVGGRISLAHEDADGYADAILEFLSDPS